MKFYINEVELKGISDYNHRCIGLFDSNTFKGEGNYCGWYGAEYYLNTTLIAFGIQELNDNIRDPYNPKLKFTGGICKDANKHYDKIQIGSCMWEELFEADTVTEAIEIFIKRKWESKYDKLNLKWR